MRTPFIAGNWKMNKNPKETQAFLDAVKGKLPDASKVETVIGAPAIDLTTLVAGAEGTPLKTAAENCYFEDEGAFTGETSPKALKEMGVDYVIIGHSERRGYFHETDEDINKKAKAIFKNNLLPIICCGETLEEREAGITLTLIKKQIVSALRYVSPENAQRCIIAYEPIWAIGTGRVATTQQAQEVCCSIRGIIRDIYGTQIADAIRILYGGSVNAGNALQLFSEPDIDGGLVGGASLKPEFSKIVNYQ